jgi:hypothetical protein
MRVIGGCCNDPKNQVSSCNYSTKFPANDSRNSNICNSLKFAASDSRNSNSSNNIIFAASDSRNSNSSNNLIAAATLTSLTYLIS